MISNKTIIYEFRDEYFFLSNFYLRTVNYGICKVTGRNIILPSNEHFFQFCKNESHEWRDNVLDNSASWSPKEIRRRGRKVELRKDWEDIKYAVMDYAVDRKFSFVDLLGRPVSPKMANLLLYTGDSLLEEGNIWKDKIWGVAYPPDMRENIRDGSCRIYGEGRNYLGLSLMRRREELGSERNI